MTFPPVQGGEVAHFNQGYFFRNYRAGGHDESDLPLLIQLSEKRGMRKPLLFMSSFIRRLVIAERRIEANNFYTFDYYEPASFSLKPLGKYTDYQFQLSVMIQLVKPSSIFYVPKTVTAADVKPIALQVDILSSQLSVSFVSISESRIL